MARKYKRRVNKRIKIRKKIDPTMGLQSTCYTYTILLVTGHIYHGYTSKHPKDRLDQHLQSAANKIKTKFYNFLRKYKVKDLSYKKHKNEYTALMYERLMIAQADKKWLLNTTSGGEGTTLKLK